MFVAKAVFSLASTSMRGQSVPRLYRWRSSPSRSFSTSSNSSNGDSENRLFPEHINILYDSKCSLCAHEMAFLAKQDKIGLLKFTDIEDPSYNERSAENGGIPYEVGMKVMHAVKYNGEIVKG